MAVAIDSTASGVQAAPNSTSLTFALVCSTLADRAVGVGVSNASTVSARDVTYGGVALTKVTGASQLLTSDGDNNEVYTSVGFLPASGSNNVVVRFVSGVADLICGAVSVTGADSTNCVAASAKRLSTGTAVSGTVVTAADELIWGHVTALHNGTASSGAAETEVYDRADGIGASVLTAHGYIQLGSAGGVVSPTLSGAGSEWAIGLISFKAASSGGAAATWGPLLGGENNRLVRTA